jgi:diadenylate cyclase
MPRLAGAHVSPLDALSGVRFADVIDILIVTALVYTTWVLIQRTRAAFVAMGIVMLGALYIVARVLDLRLTAWIFQGFFAIFLVVIVVVFQEELRQLFERVALWSLGRREAPTSDADPTDVLVSCLADFAKTRTGALIVLPGMQPVERQTHGGIELNGRLSLPLLASIFDTHSPGHDGAAIVADDRVERFAAHLPLSRDFSQLSRRGTRHSAALGLAERTDALCLVVSEERGEISVARDGHLQVVPSPQDAARAIRQFLDEKRPREERRVWTQLLREHGAQKVIAFLLVVALWYLFVPGSRVVEFTYEIPVALQNVPEGYEIEAIDPPKVSVTFSGFRRAFYFFRPERLQLTVDATLAKFGRRTFSVNKQDVQFPKELTLEELEPTTVKLSLRKTEEESSARSPSEAGASR